MIPLTPGVHSALGLLMSDVKHDYVRSKLAGLNELDLIEVNGLFAQLIEQAKADLRAEGFRDNEIRLDAFLDLRYAGQGYELTVPCPLPPLKKSDLDLMRHRFDTQHAGGKGSCIVNPEATNEKRLPSRFGDHRLQKGDLLRLERPGGGGLGNPVERPAESVLEDVRQGYVSLERARSDYAVVVELVDAEPVLNSSQTQILRGKKQKNTGKDSSPLL